MTAPPAPMDARSVAGHSAVCANVRAPTSDAAKTAATRMTAHRSGNCPVDEDGWAPWKAVLSAHQLDLMVAGRRKLGQIAFH